MAVDNLIQALASQRTIGDWSQQYRPLLNQPGGSSAPRAAALSQVLGGGIASGGIYGGGREGGDGGSGVDPANISGTASVAGPLGASDKRTLGMLGMIPGFSLGTGFTRGMDALGYRGVIGPVAPRPLTAAFRAVVNAGNQAAGAESYDDVADADEAFQGEAMRQFEQDSGGGSTDRSYSGGDYAGSTGFDRGGDRDGGDFGRGNDPGGGAEGSPFHKGGPITDRNPKTYRDNMRITAQEGEFVMSREAVGLLGRDFLNRANRVARDRK